MVKFCPFKHAAWIACPNLSLAKARELRECDETSCELWDTPRQTCGLKVTS